MQSGDAPPAPPTSYVLLLMVAETFITLFTLNVPLKTTTNLQEPKRNKWWPLFKQLDRAWL